MFNHGYFGKRFFFSGYWSPHDSSQVFYPPESRPYPRYTNSDTTEARILPSEVNMPRITSDAPLYGRP